MRQVYSNCIRETPPYPTECTLETIQPMSAPQGGMFAQRKTQARLVEVWFKLVPGAPTAANEQTRKLIGVGSRRFVTGVEVELGAVEALRQQRLIY